MGGTVGEWHKRRKLVGTNRSLPKQDRHYGSSKKDFIFINPVGVRARVRFHGLDLSNFSVINKASLPPLSLMIDPMGLDLGGLSVYADLHPQLSLINKDFPVYSFL